MVGKERTVERQQVSDTVRRERVEVDEDYDRHRTGFRQHFDRSRQQTGAQAGTRRWEEAEPNYQYGYMAARNDQHRGRRFEDVEPDLRTDYQRRFGAADDPSGWERLRAEIREGWERARG